MAPKFPSDGGADRWHEEVDAAESDRWWYEAAGPELPPSVEGSVVWVWSPKGGTGATTFAAVTASRAAQDIAAAGAPDALLVDCASGDQRHLIGSIAKHWDPPAGTAHTTAALADYHRTVVHNSDHRGLMALRSHAAAAALLDAAERVGPALRVLDVSAAQDSSPVNPLHDGFVQLLRALSTLSPVVVVDAGRDPTHRGLDVVDAHSDAQVAAVIRNCYLSVAQGHARRSPAMFARTYVVQEPRRSLRGEDMEVALGAAQMLTVPHDPRVARAVDGGLLPGVVPAVCERFPTPPNIAARLDLLTRAQIEPAAQVPTL